MGRLLKERIKVSGTLKTTSPLHVGGIDNNPDVDLPLAVDGQGRYYIPGTSLAGAFQAWTHEYDSDLTQTLWGFQKDDKGQASLIVIEDAPIDLKGAIVEVRDGVGIDRHTGAAAQHMKYDCAIIPTGSTFPLEITLEIPEHSTSTQHEEALHALLDALCAKELCIGAAKTRGLGRLTLENPKTSRQTLNTKTGIIDTLKGISPQPYNHKPTRSRPQIQFQIHWEPNGPLMVKASQDGVAVDHLPLTSNVSGKVALVIPGSSIKGALRSQAERIVRTVLCLAVDPPNASNEQSNARTAFLKQIEVPLVKDIFGFAAHSSNPDKSKGQIGALSIDDCYSANKLTPEQWQAILNATEDSQLRTALDTADLKSTQQAYHVAIDRWTGGAADGMLYSGLEPFGINWKPIQFTLDLSRFQNELKQKSAIALLLLLVRDLTNNRIPLGYGVNRGMGAITIKEVQFETKGDIPEWLKLKRLPEGEITHLDSGFLDDITNVWAESANWMRDEHE